MIRLKFSHILMIAVLLSVVGCFSSSRMCRVRPGMTKQEVISALGDPTTSASPDGGMELLRYELTSSEYPRGREYYVRLVNGKVESYGSMGDFDSAKDPTSNLNSRNR